MASMTEEDLKQKVIRYLKRHDDLDTVSLEIKGNTVKDGEGILHVVCTVQAHWERWVIFENGEIREPPSSIEVVD